MIVSLLNKLVARFRKPLQLGSAAANKLVIHQISAQGDDGRAERHVRHFAYPRGTEPRNRTDAVDLLTEAGLDVSDTQYRGGLLAEHYAAVADAEFDQLTDSLREELARLGWDYDGWECAVLKG